MSTAPLSICWTLNLLPIIHNYRFPTEKTFDVVLKHNIPTTFGENEIQNELVNLGFSVFKLMRVWDKNKQPIPVVNVYLDKKNPKNKEIFDLDRLLYCVISVEPKRRSYNVPQCNNCQRYGHTRNYCKLTPRCMFCAGKHKSAECKKDWMLCPPALTVENLMLPTSRVVPTTKTSRVTDSLQRIHLLKLLNILLNMLSLLQILVLFLYCLQ